MSVRLVQVPDEADAQTDGVFTAEIKKDPAHIELASNRKRPAPGVIDQDPRLQHGCGHFAGAAAPQAEQYLDRRLNPGARPLTETVATAAGRIDGNERANQTTRRDFIGLEGEIITS